MRFSKLILHIGLFLVFISCNNSESSKYSNLSAKGYERQLTDKDRILAFIYEENGKQGLKDTLGNTILKARYDYIEDWVQFGVVRTDSGGRDKSEYDYIHYEMNKIGLIDYKGNVLFEPQFDELNFNGYPIAVVKKGGKYDYINNKGQYEVDLIFDDATTFQNGFAVVKTQNGYGLINSEYKFVIQPRLDSLQLWYATGFTKDTMLLVFNNIDSTKMINKNGEIFDVVKKGSN